MLNSLEIKNFRLLENFQVKKLGQVNLIVGKNNSGKSSVLEALRIYAGNANQALLIKIAKSHDEQYLSNEIDYFLFNQGFPFEDLFTGRAFPYSSEKKIVIAIGEIDNIRDKLIIYHGFLIKEKVVNNDIENPISTTKETISFNQPQNNEKYKDVLITNKNHTMSIIDFPTEENKNKRFIDNNNIPCSIIPTQFISMNELAKEWDAIALTEGEDIAKKALKIILPEFEDLTFVLNTSKSDIKQQRQAKVKIANLSKPVSLNSLGDGMIRVLQLVLKIFSARDGFLLIDEFENGLHYSVQEKIWALLFQLANELNIQIFATTHSWDCIESFSKVANNNQVEGVLFRVGKSIRTSEKGRVIATVFDKEQLYNITQSDVEVR